MCNSSLSFFLAVLFLMNITGCQKDDFVAVPIVVVKVNNQRSMHFQFEDWETVSSNLKRQFVGNFKNNGDSFEVRIGRKGADRDGLFEDYAKRIVYKLEQQSSGPTKLAFYRYFKEDSSGLRICSIPNSDAAEKELFSAIENDFKPFIGMLDEGLLNKTKVSNKNKVPGAKNESDAVKTESKSPE